MVWLSRDIERACKDSSFPANNEYAHGVVLKHEMTNIAATVVQVTWSHYYTSPLHLVEPNTDAKHDQCLATITAKSRLLSLLSLLVFDQFTTYLISALQPLVRNFTFLAPLPGLRPPPQQPAFLLQHRVSISSPFVNVCDASALIFGGQRSVYCT